MNTETTYEYASSSLENTLSFAQKVGAVVKPGAVIELQSDVGGGKTTFVRGLAQGIGSSDQVSSPTFTISKYYEADNSDVTIHHFDFYRLDDPGLMRAEIAESLLDDTVLTVVEWAGIVEDVLPKDRLVIEISQTGETSRLFTLKAGNEHEYILRGVRS